ncbi:MAG: hypothetical protein J5727_07370 [Kiritimatiellae bacterium]|nr:hypothetical protein [Kiritimatiellia bacterium]
MRRIFLAFALAAILCGCTSTPHLAEKEKAPAGILAVSEREALHVWKEALADDNNHFDEPTLVALAGRLFQDMYDDFDYCKNRVIDSLFSRPEFTEKGLRALEPLLLTEDNSFPNYWYLIAVYMSHPEVPADILSAYADLLLNYDDSFGWDDPTSCVCGVRHLVARRLLEREQKGASLAPAPISTFARFIQRLMETPMAIPEELELESPVEGWIIEPKDYVFVHTPAKGSSLLADAPCALAGAQLLFKEPFQSAADWRSKVRAVGLTLTFPSSEMRKAFLREIVPAYAMTGELPKLGYPMRPDIRKVVGYIVTTEEIGGLPALRFTRRWPRR